jgi:hypothetical protein
VSNLTGGQQGPGTAAAPAAAAAAHAPAPASTSEAGDWRLRAPDPATEGPRFKPGATTWDTEDYTTAEGKANKRVQVIHVFVVTTVIVLKMMPQKFEQVPIYASF